MLTPQQQSWQATVGQDKAGVIPESGPIEHDTKRTLSLNPQVSPPYTLFLPLSHWTRWKNKGGIQFHSMACWILLPKTTEAGDESTTGGRLVLPQQSSTWGLQCHLRPLQHAGHFSLRHPGQLYMDYRWSCKLQEEVPEKSQPTSCYLR